MRLVVTAFADSIHTARYLQLLDGTGWEVHLVGATNGPAHPDLPAVVVHGCPGSVSGDGALPVEPVPCPELSFEARAELLGAVIDEVRPHVVHSHEIQHGSALVERLVRRRGSVGAKWLVTNWGSDIMWYGRSRSHARLIRAVLSGCDYYCSECQRDVALARAFGFRGQVIGVWPVAGGVDLAAAHARRAPGPTSARRAIAIKGLVGGPRQGQVALAAVERCSSLLAGWELCGYQMDPAVDARAREVADRAGMSYTRLSFAAAKDSTYEEVLAMHGRSRVSLALNHTDGLSTSLLEAMAMGSFPVHSAGSCAGELTPPGRGALFVPPTDVEAVTDALRRALTDDELVDGAAELNAHLASEHLDRDRIGARVVDAYERIAQDAALEKV